MKVQAKNYVAQALKDTREFLDREARKGRKMECNLLALEDAVHFTLPSEGEILPDFLRSAESLTGPIRLPFESISLEFEIEALEGRKGGMVLAAQELLNKEGDVSALLVYPWFWLPPSGKWVPPTMGITLPKNWEDLEFSGGGVRIPSSVFSLGPDYTLAKDIAESKEEGHHTFVRRVQAGVLEFLLALTCSNVSHEVIQAADPGVNARRLRKGKLPLLETRCLTITVPGNKTYRVEDSDGDGDHERNSPRQHLRRGHIRRLSDDRRVWVNSCIVGDPSKGRIEKSYAVRSAA